MIIAEGQVANKKKFTIKDCIGRLSSYKIQKWVSTSVWLTIILEWFMKKILLLIAFCFAATRGFSLPSLENRDGQFFFSQNPQKEEEEKAKKKSENEIALLLEAKGGYFFFGDEKMRKVYPNGGLDVQLALSGRVWKWLHVYGAAEYIQRSGKSLHGHQSTSIEIVPLSLAIKPTFSIASWLDFYFDLGPRYFFVMQHNKSDYVNKHVDVNGLGGFAGLGFYVHLNRRIILDAFGEYSYFAPRYSTFMKNVYTRTIDVGGATFGGGLGYSF